MRKEQSTNLKVELLSKIDRLAARHKLSLHRTTTMTVIWSLQKRETLMVTEDRMLLIRHKFN